MNYENIEIASQLKSDIETFKLEISSIERLVNAERPNKSWLFARMLKRKPTEKTYKGYYCTRGLDSIESVTLINPREAQAVIEVKKQEIEELEQKIAQLN